MSHQDQAETSVVCQGQQLLQAVRWLMPQLSGLSQPWRSDCTWSFEQLVATALWWSWSGEFTLTDRFQQAHTLLCDLTAPPAQPAASYQAFGKLLVRWSDNLLTPLLEQSRHRIRTTLAVYEKLHGYIVFACDGSRMELPRTVSNEKEFGPQARVTKRRRRRQRYAKRSDASKAQRPHLWVTTLWHAGTGLPWDWRIGPGNSCEREHALEMLPSLPAESLLTVDAGYVGYDWIRAVVRQGHHLLLRVGANVRLLKNLGYVQEDRGLVYLWPDQAQAKWRPPVVLRPVVVRRPGKKPIYLVTTLRREDLSDAAIAEIYARRWGVEVLYRHLKQTLGRGKLRSKSAAMARVEMAWSLAGLLALLLCGERALVRAGQDPRRLSLASAWRVVRRLLRDYRKPLEHGQGIWSRLAQALVDPYRRRNKKSRCYPQKKRFRSPGLPVIKRANWIQQYVATSLRELRLTA